MCFERPLEGIQLRLSETHTQPTSAETLTQRIRDQPKSHDTSRLIDDECTNLHFAADRSRKSPESGFDDTQHPIAAQPNSLRETPRGEPRPRFARTVARRATRQDAEGARRIWGTKALLRRIRAPRRFFRAQRRENAGSGKIRTPIVPWVARFCWILFFFDAWRRVTHRNRRAKYFLVRRSVAANHVFVFFVALGTHTRTKLKTAAHGRRITSSTSKIGSGTELADPRLKAGNLPRCRIFVNHALLRRPHDLRLGSRQRLARLLTVAGGNRLFDDAQRASHAGVAHLIDRRAPCDLARGLSG